MEGTYHRRELKLPAIAFSSAEGRVLFSNGMSQGYLESYFYLAEHYQTQSHPAFCGIASLAMALNGLLVDPQRKWQGVWRWYDESMLDSCESHEVMKLKGVTLSKLACFGRCNRAHVELRYGTDVLIEKFRAEVKSVCSNDKSHIQDWCAENCSTSMKDMDVDSCHCEGNVSDENKSLSRVMIVSYHRGTLNQTGSGHFSPIGGYDECTDHILIMDVARFKYSPHWVPLESLYNAMQVIDPDTDKSRGYLLLSSTKELIKLCCKPDTVDENTDRLCSRYSHSISEDGIQQYSDEEVKKSIDTENRNRLHEFLNHCCDDCCCKKILN
eukprot:TRINITY_DN112302_c0_g1_i1.p1 TRINITY_DN112302_c0_g1~~TRINITY_DN112302_c0_g1_i1.p1  ORF type:complete len:326 (-),score=-29.08 TRINITY_DN112302_c0_g1_i1:8-985(-)